MTRNRPLTQIDVENEIMRRIEMLDAAIDEYDLLAETAAEKSSQYKNEWAREFLRAQAKTVREREAMTDHFLRNLNQEQEIANALAKAKQQRMGAIRTQLDALRTLAANVRNATNGS